MVLSESDCQQVTRGGSLWLAFAGWRRSKASREDPGVMAGRPGWCRRARVAGFLLLGFLLIPARANVVLDWSAVMMAAIRSDNSGPTLSTRNLAILHLAIYDAVNAITRTHQPYHVVIDTPAEASAEAAAVGAGYKVLKELYPGRRAQADAAFSAWQATVPADRATTNGLQLGETVAYLTLAMRASDGSATEIPYIPSEAPGQWRRTPPFYRPPFTPQWRYVDLFALPALEPFVPPPPPPLDSPEYAEAFDEVKALGAKNSPGRTAEQTESAVFWSDFSYTAMPPGHWHEIAAGIARDQGTGLVETARLMALLSLAQADSAIVCWEAKYRYNLWRPVTAIQRADEDGNPATEADPTWEQLLAAPPFPAYTSGHSTFSKAGAEMLTLFYGTDAVTFTAVSDALPGVLRTYHSLAACADEIGMSRIYGGIHFQFDNREGKLTGQRISRHIAANYLLPDSALPFVRIEGKVAGELWLRIHGHIGASFVVEGSPDLSAWEPVADGQVQAGGVAVRVASAEVACRFFRVREP